MPGPFRFEDYGTFTGPLSITGTYNYELSSQETGLEWDKDLPVDTSFELTDIAVVLFHNEIDYVGMYCYGNSTQFLNVGHANGNIPCLSIDADTVLLNSEYASVLGDVFVAGSVTAPTFVGALQGVASGNKLASAFDIPHAKQKGKRIRHIVAEGPEPGIYVRGKLKDKNVIELPDYWEGLIDPETITITLTQIGYSQDLIVDRIEWGKNIIIRSGVGANIHCYYEVWASRWLNPTNQEEKLHVVYDGETPEDYPGDNKQFLIGGWDYDRRNPQWSFNEDVNLEGN